MQAAAQPLSEVSSVALELNPQVLAESIDLRVQIVIASQPASGCQSRALRIVITQSATAGTATDFR